ncbi:MAG: UvrB/UvrC motif-containing protein [Pirellulaceae bacterium]
MFQLRDCPDKTKFEFGAQLTLFDEPPRAQCIRFELGSCPAPCARVCSPESYRNNVTRALDFLNGPDRETLNRLEEAMTKASLEQNFERAAVIHRQWEALRRLDRQLGRLRRCEQAINGVMSCRVSRSRQLWMVLRGGRLVATFPEPRSKRQAEEAIQSLESARLQPVHSPENILHINLQLIVASWFRKRPEDIDSLQTFEKLIDECKRRVELYSRVA